MLEAFRHTSRRGAGRSRATMSPYLYPAATTFRLLDLKIALVAARGIEIIEEDLLLPDLQHYIQAAYLKYALGSYCSFSLGHSCLLRT